VGSGGKAIIEGDSIYGQVSCSLDVDTYIPPPRAGGGGAARTSGLWVEGGGGHFRSVSFYSLCR